MARPSVFFPADSTANIGAKIAQYPGCQLSFYQEGEHHYAQVVPAQISGATVKAADAVDMPAPDNDSFICPGDPRCPK